MKVGGLYNRRGMGTETIFVSGPGEKVLTVIENKKN